MNIPDKTILNIKVNKDLKHEAQALADELGIPLSTVVIANLKDFVRSRSLTISALARLKPEIEQEIGGALKDYQTNKNISKSLQNEREITKHLKSL